MRAYILIWRSEKPWSSRGDAGVIRERGVWLGEVYYTVEFAARRRGRDARKR
jgi:hypothetical protein